MKNLWFTSDTHFGHKKVIEFCNRPFESVAEMDEQMIARWNFLVKDGDEVYHMGDFAFCGAVRTQEILSQLRGRKILVQGNHDHFKPEKYKRLGFHEVHPWLQWGERSTGIMLSHFPYKGYETDERVFLGQLVDDGGWLIHGHVHNGWKVNKRMINVGVDQWEFAPVSWDEISDILRKESTRGE